MAFFTEGSFRVTNIESPDRWHGRVNTKYYLILRADGRTEPRFQDERSFQDHAQFT